MRALVLLVVACCTLNGRPPNPVAPLTPPDEGHMSSSVLDRQDPGADTSNNPVLSRSEAHYRDPNDLPWKWLGCFRMFACSTAGDSDGSGALVVLAVFAVTRRREKS